MDINCHQGSNVHREFLSALDWSSRDKKKSEVNFIAFMDLHCIYAVIVKMHWYEMLRQIYRSNVTKRFKFKGY